VIATRGFRSLLRMNKEGVASSEPRGFLRSESYRYAIKRQQRQQSKEPRSAAIIEPIQKIYPNLLYLGFYRTTLKGSFL
jgi:hypothetical protein